MDKTDEIKNKIRIGIKIILVVIVLNLAFAGFVIARNTSWKEGKAENLKIYYSNIARECIASTLEWDGNYDNMTFTIPDEYEGLKVKSLGGVPGMAPTEFFISIPEVMHPEATGTTEDEECIGETDEDTVTYSFTVNLGNNMRKFEHFAYKEYYMDENGKVIYIVEIHYECSPDNKWVYSQDGKIYDKKTNELID